MTDRRKLLTSIGALFITAPAIVRASSLMAINTALMPPLFPTRLVLVTAPAGVEPVERMRFCADGTVLIRDDFTGRMVPI
jgi:hypothetical protein